MNATAQDYLNLARAMNDIAGATLGLDRPLAERETDGRKGKVSLGLSLQAAELAGKGMLVALGVSPKSVRRKFGDHDLMKLLLAVERKLSTSSDPKYIELKNFMLWAPVIDGVQFGTTMKVYFNNHFARGEQSKPRNYFYPDEPIYSAPTPYNTIHVLVDRLNWVLEQLVTA